MITIRVGSGSAMFTLANMFSNAGMTKISSIEIAIAATLMMTAG